MAAIPFKVERLIGKNFNAVKCSTLATWQLYNGRVKVETTFLTKIKVESNFVEESESGNNLFEKRECGNNLLGKRESENNLFDYATKAFLEVSLKQLLSTFMEP